MHEAETGGYHTKEVQLRVVGCNLLHGLIGLRDCSVHAYLLEFARQ